MNHKIVIYNNYDNAFAFQQNIPLNSGSLLKLIELHKSQDISDLFGVKSLCDSIIINSILLYEDRSYFNFDPYCNFLLNGNATSQDIKDIINLLNKNERQEKDFSNVVNPYGLEKVVFMGGGTKGVIYIGTMIALYSTGQIFYLNQFIGTSIGALTSMVMGCITPPAEEYNMISKMTLKEILSEKKELCDKYKEAIRFVTERFYNRNIDTFYPQPNFTFYGAWTMLDTIVKNNGLYDPQKSGFHVWYALICKKVCQIMGNGLDQYIIIKNKNEVVINEPDYDTSNFEGWELSSYFTFEQYNKLTSKSLVFTGTKKIETVYYRHTDKKYKDLSVMTAAGASMSIPWVFKAPIIGDTYNLDGGLFDNYPLTHCDIKIRDKITHYNNKIFGYFIDDKNTTIDIHEILRELWLIYNGFIEIMTIGYLKDSQDYVKISEMFFEIRLEVYKLLYYVDNEIKSFFDNDSMYNINELEKILQEINNQDLVLPKRNIRKILESLASSNNTTRIGKKSNLSDVMNTAVNQGGVYNDLMNDITHDIHLLDNSDNNQKLKEILEYLIKNILVYYELKGAFVKSGELISPSYYLIDLIKNLDTKLLSFNKLTAGSKNYIQSSIDIATSMTQKILTRNNNDSSITNNNNVIIESDKASYQKLIDYFFHTDMTGIMTKYTCIANDRLCNDSVNQMRTIRLNTFETSVLHFGMDTDLKARLIYEGFTKTIKYFSSILYILEITGKNRSPDEFIESYEIRFKNYINKLSL